MRRKEAIVRKSIFSCRCGDNLKIFLGLVQNDYCLMIKFLSYTGIRCYLQLVSLLMIGQRLVAIEAVRKINE